MWFILNFCLNIIYTAFLWIATDEKFLTLFFVIFLGTGLIYVFFGLILYEISQKKYYALVAYLQNPSKFNEKECRDYLDDKEAFIFNMLKENTNEMKSVLEKQKIDLKEYENYIRKWSHEIKTPLSLIGLVLDNRKDEMSSNVQTKLEYAKTRIQEDVDRVLYYSRVKAEHVDYNMKKENIKLICDDVLLNYRALIDENNIEVYNELDDVEVLTDKNGISFIINQIISNAIKYKNNKLSNSYIKLYYENNKEFTLIIEDNGIGVKDYDLPFIFDNGFVGSNASALNSSTGMGLYLAIQIARSLKLKVEVCEDYEIGFKIKLIF